MTATAMKSSYLQSVLNSGDLTQISNALSYIQFGNMVEVVKVTFASLSSSSTVDITTAASKAAATTSGIYFDPDGAQTLPAIGQVVTLRVTAGAAAAGTRVVSDAGGTATAGGGVSAAPGIATLSDDGKVLTFETTVTGFVLTYIPRAAYAPATTVLGFAP